MKRPILFIILIPLLFLITACAEDMRSSPSQEHLEGREEPIAFEKPSRPSTGATGTTHARQPRKQPQEPQPLSQKEQTYETVDECITQWDSQLDNDDMYLQSDKVYVIFRKSVSYDTAKELLEDAGATNVEAFNLFSEIFDIDEASLISTFAEGGMMSYDAPPGQSIEHSCEVERLNEVDGATPDFMFKGFEDLTQ